MFKQHFLKGFLVRPRSFQHHLMVLASLLCCGYNSIDSIKPLLFHFLTFFLMFYSNIMFFSVIFNLKGWFCLSLRYKLVWSYAFFIVLNNVTDKLWCFWLMSHCCSLPIESLFLLLPLYFSNFFFFSLTLYKFSL